MEEDTVELIDYFRVVWKRKILIIVVILVCIVVGVGVGVVNSMSKLPVTYQADVIVKIGQKLVLTPSSGVSAVIDYIESPGGLVGTIPRKYSFKVTEAPGYHLEVKQIGAVPMLKLILKGPDRGVERVLNEIVDMVIDDHRRKTNVSAVLYTGFIKKLEADANMFQENIAINETTIKELKRRGGIHLENMVATGAETKEEKSESGQSAFLNMLYLKTIDQERDLSRNRKDLRNTEWQLILYQTTIGDREKYNTKMIGVVKSSAVEPIKKSTLHIIIVAGVAGLIMSLFIAFFKEYIVESKSKRKGK